VLWSELKDALMNYQIVKVQRTREKSPRVGKRREEGFYRGLMMQEAREARVLRAFCGQGGKQS
jgi:hypothetical protein